MTAPNLNTDITQEQLQEILHYNKDTGVFTWKIDRGNKKVGDFAGSPKPDGYLCIGVNGRKYRAHRLAWFMTFGCWPKEIIDHVNGDRADNRIANLRESTAGENQRNRTKVASHATNYVPFPGVCLITNMKLNNPWRVAHAVDTIQKFYFCKDEATAITLKKALLHGFTPAKTGTYNEPIPSTFLNLIAISEAYLKNLAASKKQD